MNNFSNWVEARFSTADDDLVNYGTVAAIGVAAIAGLLSSGCGPCEINPKRGQCSRVTDYASTGTSGSETTTLGSTDTSSSSNQDTTSGPEVTEDEVCSGDRWTVDDTYRAISLHLGTIDFEDQPFTRYIELSAQYNQGSCDDELAALRDALVKGLHHLTREPTPITVSPVDERGVVLSFDIRDVGFDAAVGDGEVVTDRWDALAAANHQSLVYAGGLADSVRSRAATDFPVQSLSSFLREATRGAQYRALLDIPETLDALLLEYGCLTLTDASLADLVDAEVIRACTNHSGVARAPRCVQRNPPQNTGPACWISYETVGADQDGNPFLDPIGFNFLGGEGIIALPNGFNAYFIFNAAGALVDEAPVSLVANYDNPDNPVVVNGISCIGCHDRGYISVTDELRDHFSQPGAPLGGLNLNALKDLFVENAELSAFVAQDRERFESAASALGVSTSDEPVTRVVFDYEDEVTPSRAAAELGLSEAEFSVLLPVFSSKQLSTNFPLERDQFNVDFLGYACESQRALENIPAGCEGA